jgi:hypothetical protein
VSNEWQHQIRIYLNDDFIDAARSDSGNAALKPLAEVLRKHDATIHNQFDAFAGYVAEAEQRGVAEYPLYKWTKVTIEDPEKKAKHLKIFSVHINGEGVYPRAAAEALEADLRPLVGGAVVNRLTAHDSNPANNPQVPEHLR